MDPYDKEDWELQQRSDRLPPDLKANRLDALREHPTLKLLLELNSVTESSFRLLIFLRGREF